MQGGQGKGAEPLIHAAVHAARLSARGPQPRSPLGGLLALLHVSPESCMLVAQSFSCPAAELPHRPARWPHGITRIHPAHSLCLSLSLYLSIYLSISISISLSLCHPPAKSFCAKCPGRAGLHAFTCKCRGSKGPSGRRSDGAAATGDEVPRAREPIAITNCCAFEPSHPLNVPRKCLMN